MAGTDKIYYNIIKSPFFGILGMFSRTRPGDKIEMLFPLGEVENQVLLIVDEVISRLLMKLFSSYNFAGPPSLKSSSKAVSGVKVRILQEKLKQFHIMKFIIDGQTYDSAEQYMIHQKACK